MKAIVTCDIASHAKKGHVYAAKGERVAIVAKHGEVLIVEGKTGRFPVHKKHTDKTNV